MVKVEGTLEELRAMFVAGVLPRATTKSTSTKKKGPGPKKTKRAPSAYNKYMKKELARLKKKHPKTPHATLFKRAAKSWKGGKKK